MTEEIEKLRRILALSGILVAIVEFYPQSTLYFKKYCLSYVREGPYYEPKVC